MPPYRKRTTSTKKNTTSADWQGLAYYSIIGVVCYIAFMAIRSLSLGSGNKSSFFDWLKSIFNILEAGTGGSGTSGTSPEDYGNDNAGYETQAEGNNSGTDLYSSAIKDFQYFKASEYFGNHPRPTNPTFIANYNTLMKDLDLIRLNFGSAIKIVTGYKSSDLAIFQECKGAHIKASNGANDALNKVVLALRNSSQLKGSSVYMPDSGETRYFNK